LEHERQGTDSHPHLQDPDPQKSYVTKNNEFEDFIGGYCVQGDGVQQVGQQWEGVDQAL
jgi:hypothetical protein